MFDAQDDVFFSPWLHCSAGSSGKFFGEIKIDTNETSVILFIQIFNLTLKNEFTTLNLFEKSFHTISFSSFKINPSIWVNTTELV